jgi:K+-sensing histidine kinase KdpD
LFYSWRTGMVTTVAAGSVMDLPEILEACAECGEAISDGQDTYVYRITVFSKYYRASTSIGIKGTGIGLAGAKAIVTQHGGHITLDSIVGQGTTVVISLPCCPHPWSNEESDEEEVQIPAPTAQCMPHDWRQATGGRQQ